MLEWQRQVRNGERVRQCHPVFRQGVKRVLRLLEQDGYRPRIQDAFRSPELQMAAYQAGRSSLVWGFHNATTPDGQPDALAVDILDDEAPLAPSRRFMLALAIAADRCGLETGICWGLPPELRTALRAAIAARTPDAVVKVGWDPCHVQVAGLSVTEARSGQRPVEVRYV